MKLIFHSIYMNFDGNYELFEIFQNSITEELLDQLGSPRIVRLCSLLWDDRLLDQNREILIKFVNFFILSKDLKTVSDPDQIMGTINSFADEYRPEGAQTDFLVYKAFREYIETPSKELEEIIHRVTGA